MRNGCGETLGHAAVRLLWMLLEKSDSLADHVLGVVNGDGILFFAVKMDGLEIFIRGKIIWSGRKSFWLLSLTVLLGIQLALLRGIGLVAC